MMKTEEYDNKALFDQLKQRPVVAWPTVIIMVFCFSAIVAVWYYCLTGRMSLFVGCIINSLANYLLFSPIHDSMHQAVMKKTEYNKVVLAMSVFPSLPFSTGQFLRMMHMQHHRFLNDELDPDHEVSKNWRNAFFVWMLWGFKYYTFYLKHKNELPNFNKKLLIYDNYIIIAVVAPLFFIIPAEMFFLWLIPTLAMSWLICATFMFLPHYPHDVKFQDDPYQSTSTRMGYEWLMSPLLVGQNYHLIHHLYPTVPFYRYRKIWKANYSNFMSHNPRIVSAFRLRPDR